MVTQFIIASTLQYFENILKRIESELLSEPIFNRNRSFESHIAKQKFISDAYKSKIHDKIKGRPQPWFLMSWDRGSLRKSDDLNSSRNFNTRINVAGEIRLVSVKYVILPISIIIFTNQQVKLDRIEEYLLVEDSTGDIISHSNIDFINKLGIRLDRLETTDRGFIDIDNLGSLSSLSIDLEVSFMLPVLNTDTQKIIHQIDFSTFVDTKYGSILDNTYHITKPIT